MMYFATISINSFWLVGLILTCWTLWGEETETVLSEFLNSHDAKSMVKVKTCVKSINNPTCVDLLISNKEVLQICYNYDTVLSYFHKMVLVVLKKKFEKPKPKVISYRD